MPVSHGNVRSLRRLPTPVHRKVNKVGNCKAKLRLLALKISPKSIERRSSRGPGGLQALTCTNTKAKLWCRALTNPVSRTPQSGPPTTALVAPARNGAEISRKFLRCSVTAEVVAGGTQCAQGLLLAPGDVHVPKAPLNFVEKTRKALRSLLGAAPAGTCPAMQQPQRLHRFEDHVSRTTLSGVPSAAAGAVVWPLGLKVLAGEGVWPGSAGRLCYCVLHVI